MRSTRWLPFGFALLLPATGVLGACGPDVDTVPTGGGGAGGTPTGGGGTTTTPTGGGGTGGDTGGTGGIGGTGGTGGTGGFEIPANDACDGEKVTVAVGASVVVSGTLNGATDDYQTFCADTTPEPDNAEVVYELDIPAEVTATLKINGGGFNPALSLRRQDCSSRFNGDACLIGDSGTLDTKVALAPGMAWLVVETADGNTGDFDIEVTLEEAKCGDGVLNPGEKCDPATAMPDDGCIDPGKPNQCNFGEPPPDPAIVQCPGGLITIGKGDSFQLGLYNNGVGQSNFRGTCSPDPAAGAAPSGPENVFHLVPTGDGTLTAQIGHAADGMLYCDVNPLDCADFFMYLRKNACTSAAPADELGCVDNTPNPNAMFGYDELLTITVPVTANTDYWLFVDGLDQEFGVGGYFLEISLD